MNNISVSVTFDDKEANNLIPSNESKEEFRDKIYSLQSAMMEMKDCHVEPELNHYFAPGMYAREMTIEAGVTIVGKIHKHAHINIISKGVIDVVTEFGTARYKAPYTFISEPGTKRCVHAVTDTLWTTIHAVESTDLEEIEKEVIAKDYNDIELIENKAGDL